MTTLNKSEIALKTTHKPPMLLIDCIAGWGDSWVRSEVWHQQPTHFSREDGTTPSYLCMEYLAQTAAVYDGILRSARSEPPRMGFLLGTRKLHLPTPFFARNEKISMLLQRELEEKEDSIAVFACKVFRKHGDNETLIAKTLIKAIAPNNSDDIIFGLRHRRT